MPLVRTAEPAVEPITIAEAIAHCRVDTTNQEPAPSAPTAALAGAGAGNVDNGVHRYALTFGTADGETQLGTISAAVTVADKTTNGKVSLTNIPIGGAAVTSRKLYRTAAGGSTYLLLATLADNTTTTYTDNIADSSLGAGAPSTNTTGDPYLRSLIVAARNRAEQYLNRALIGQTWRLTLDAFPSGTEIVLGKASLLSVSSITYIDGDGATQTLATSVYAVDTDHFPGRVYLKYGQSWPGTQAIQNAVTITFTAGFGVAASSVPEAIKQAMKLDIGHLYRNRETLAVAQLAALPFGYEALLAPYRHLSVV